MSDFLYSVEREFAAPMAQVWQAWVDAQALQEWYHPTDLSNVPGSATSDAVVGGVWSVAVAVPQHDFVAYFYGRYTEVVLHEKLVHTLCYTQDEAEFDARDDNAPHHVIVIDFEEREGGTWAKFSQFGELPEGEAAQAQAGMESYFDSLAAYLA